MFTRYAIYHAPANSSDLGRLGAEWLGRDTTLDAAPVVQPAPNLPGCRPMGELVAAAHRYGLHGTLKPPMRLADGQSGDDLTQAVAAWASTRAPVDLGRLRVVALGPFLALVLVMQPAALVDFAADLVRDLDRFRVPLTDADLARHRQSGLSLRQEALLAEWGYPYVMDELRFHITLTGPLKTHERAPVQAAAEAHFAPALRQPEIMAALAVFAEDEAGVFHLISRLPLQG